MVKHTQTIRIVCIRVSTPLKNITTPFLPSPFLSALLDWMLLVSGWYQRFSFAREISVFLKLLVMSIHVEALCWATGFMKENGMLPYPVEQSFQKDFRFFSTSSYVAVRNLKLLVLLFRESIYEIMTSLLARLFPTSPLVIYLFWIDNLQMLVSI